MTDRLLTNQRNADIKDLYAQGITCNELADLYGLSKSYIAIVVKDLPKHFGAGQIRKVNTVRGSRSSRNDRWQKIKQGVLNAHKTGQKQTAIARQFGVAQTYVSKVIRAEKGDKK